MHRLPVTFTLLVGVVSATTAAGVADPLDARGAPSGAPHAEVVATAAPSGSRSGETMDATEAVAPAAPTGLEARVYSRTAAEIFWTRPTTFGLTYDVTRDGETLATTAGTSFFDDTLEAGRTYTYGIAAIDREGRRSATSGVTLTTPGSHASTSVISRRSYAGLLTHVFELYVGYRYNATLMPLMGSYSEVISVDPSYGPTREDDGVVRARYDCESGRAELDLNPTGTNAGEFFQFRFDECLDRGLLRDGTIDANRGGYASWVRSEGLGLETDRERRLLFSGYARRQDSESRMYLSPAWETVGLNLVGRDDDGEFALRDATTRFAFAYVPGSDEASLSGSLSIRSNATGGQLLFVSTPVEFTYRWDYSEPPGSSGGQIPRDDPDAPWSESDATPERRDDWYFASGQLEIVGEDGSRLLLDADTGDAASVRVTIDNELGIDTFVTAWTPWRSRLRFDPDVP